MKKAMILAVLVAVLTFGLSTVQPAEAGVAIYSVNIKNCGIYGNDGWMQVTSTDGKFSGTKWLWFNKSTVKEMLAQCMAANGTARVWFDLSQRTPTALGIEIAK